MEEDQPKQKKAAGGAPAWMASFADLMSLLLVFFILILSFAEIDRKRFKVVSGSLKMAFGVQTEQLFENIPLTNSFTKEEYSSAKDSLVQVDQPPIVFKQEADELDEIVSASKEDIEEDQREQFQENMDVVQQILGEDESSGLIEIATEGRKVVIRVKESASFPSGSDIIQPEFIPTMRRLAQAVKKVSGEIEFSGHTDNLPIKNTRFRNNWDLSASRASTLGSGIIEMSKVDPSRVKIAGHADTRPLVKNNSPENRARNRRVEIVINPLKRIPNKRKKIERERTKALGE